MGEVSRVYSPIRITVDEYADRVNEGIMQMNEQIEEHIIDEVKNNIK